MVFEQNKKIPESVWDNKNIVSFNIPVSDTASAHNIYLNIRNSGKYNYSNLYLFITTIAPNNNTLKDTLQIVLADRHGKWLGKGVGDIWFHKVPYKMNVRFPVRGIYQIEIEHAMRDKFLPEIYDVGVRVELLK